MNDRELLELAAKAAGIEHPGGEHCLYGPALWDCMRLCWWRPLTDDGDALRLAVLLRLTISCERRNDDDYMGATPPHTHQSCDCLVDQDQFAATRRAIVRAAAEIGRAMP